MENMSPYSELSESFLTPPKPHAFESKDIYGLNNKQGRILSSSLYNNNPSQDLKDLETPSSPKHLRTVTHLRDSREYGNLKQSLIAQSIDASKILCSRTTPGKGSIQMDDKDILIIQSAIKDLRNSIICPQNTSIPEKENTDINYKCGDKFKKLNDMISLEKCYSLRSSVHKYPQQNLSKSMFEGKDEMLDKLDVIEHTLNTYLKSNNDDCVVNKRIEQSRFTYVLKTVESNIENLLEKIMYCHPSNSKNAYSFLKFTQPAEYSKKRNECLFERSSVISTPSIVCEENIINSIFKLLSRADTAITNLTETLKQENKLRTDIKNLASSHQNNTFNLGYEEHLEEIRINHERELNSVKAQYEEKIKELEKSAKLHAQELSSQYQLMLSKQLEKINTNNSESIDKMVKIGRDRESQINQLIEALELKDKRSNDTSNFVTNKSYKRLSNSGINVVDECYPANESSYVSSQQPNEDSKSFDSCQQQEDKYKNFMTEFSSYRKQEMDMFRSNQLLFVKNLQKEVEKLTSIVKSTVGKKPEQVEQTDDLHLLDDSI